ncbi:MAG: hypothetical protein RL499_822 [Actinomycetota bacterium]
MTPAAITRLVVGLVLGGAVAAVLIVLLLRPTGAPGADAPLNPSETPAPRWAEPAPLPPAAATSTRAGVAGLADPAWVAAAAADTGIPERVLAAYAGAAIAKHAERPDCVLGWNTLAGIGWVESRHGSYGGASVADDGTVSPPIIGIALDGVSTALIADTDGGAIDGDAEFDRPSGRCSSFRVVGPTGTSTRAATEWLTRTTSTMRRSPRPTICVAPCRAWATKRRGARASRLITLTRPTSTPWPRRPSATPRSPTERPWFLHTLWLLYCYRASSVGDHTGRVRAWRVTQVAKGI